MKLQQISFVAISWKFSFVSHSNLFMQQIGKKSLFSCFLFSFPTDVKRPGHSCYRFSAISSMTKRRMSKSALSGFNHGSQEQNPMEHFMSSFLNLLSKSSTSFSKRESHKFRSRYSVVLWFHNDRCDLKSQSIILFH